MPEIYFGRSSFRVRQSHIEASLIWLHIDWFSLQISNSLTKPYTIDLWSRMNPAAAGESDIECLMVRVVIIQRYIQSYTAHYSM